MKRIACLILMLTGILSCASPRQETAGAVYVVDCNGSGDFRSVQACLDALPSKPDGWRTIRILPGEYREKVTVDVYKDKVAIVGCGATPEEVRIVWDDHTGRVAHGHEMTTYDSWTLSIQADDIYLANLTVENDAGRVGQAVALETRGDRIWIDGCRLVGDQDTFFTKDYVSRVYVTDSYIEGTTDFIFGPSIVYFQNCILHGKVNSYLTAASTTERNKFGYIFDACTVTAADGVERLYLGRPWKSTARTVWICCDLPEAIVPEGWHDWNDPIRQTSSFYAEYGCTGAGSERSKRVPWSHLLTTEQALEHTDLAQVFAKKTGSEQFYDDWMPTDESYVLNLRAEIRPEAGNSSLPEARKGLEALRTQTQNQETL